MSTVAEVENLSRKSSEFEYTVASNDDDEFFDARGTDSMSDASQLDSERTSFGYKESRERKWAPALSPTPSIGTYHEATPKGGATFADDEATPSSQRQKGLFLDTMGVGLLRTSSGEVKGEKQCLQTDFDLGFDEIDLPTGPITPVSLNAPSLDQSPMRVSDGSKTPSIHSSPLSADFNQEAPRQEGERVAERDIVKDLDSGKAYEIEDLPPYDFQTFQNPLVPGDRKQYTWKRRKQARGIGGGAAGAIKHSFESPLLTLRKTNDFPEESSATQRKAGKLLAAAGMLGLNKSPEYEELQADNRDAKKKDPDEVEKGACQESDQNPMLVKDIENLGRTTLLRDFSTDSAEGRGRATGAAIAGSSGSLHRRSPSFDSTQSLTKPSSTASVGSFTSSMTSSRDASRELRGRGRFGLGLLRGGRSASDQEGIKDTPAVFKKKLGWSGTLEPLWKIGSFGAHNKGKAIWTMEWSQDGQFLATGGEDGMVIIWQLAANVGSDTPRRRSSNFSVQTEALDSGGNLRLAERSRVAIVFPVLDETPYRQYEEHVQDVVQVAWSKTGFLLSGSIDHTVRLWHPRQHVSMGTFEHPDMITALAWHPLHDKTFLTACFDKRLRIWQIRKKSADASSPVSGATSRAAYMDREGGYKQYRKPKQSLVGTVEEYVQAPDVPTACAISPDGQFAVCGLFNGTVFFYRADTMRYFTQISCRNRRGRHKEGRKVTGLAFRPLGKEEEEEDAKRRSLSGSRRGLPFLSNRNVGRKYHLLVSTNDNRLRLFDTGSFNQVGKFKGFTCEDLQLRASFSSDGCNIISASEDGKVYVWSTFYDGHQRREEEGDESSRRGFRRNSVLSKTTNDGYEWFRVESATAGGGESEGSAGSSASCICTAASFAPVAAVAALEETYGGEFYDPQALPPQPEDDELSSKGGPILSLDEWSSEKAKATRVLFVGDYDGVLHVYARGSYSDLL